MMRRYNLLRSILFGTIAATTLASPTTLLDGAPSSSSSSSPLLRFSSPSSNNNNDNNNQQITTAFDHGSDVIRRLEENSNQEALQHCSDYTTGMVTCLLIECLSQPCQSQNNNNNNDKPAADDGPSGGNGNGQNCNSLTKEICGAFDLSCCPQCTSKATDYLNCLLDFSNLCPGATCGAGGDTNEVPADPRPGKTNNSTGTSSNTTTSTTTAAADGDESESVTVTSGGGGSNNNSTESSTNNNNSTGGSSRSSSLCTTAVQELEVCVEDKCEVRQCDANPGANPPGSEFIIMDDCDSVTEGICNAVEETADCCPECAEEASKYLVCFLESLDCPDAACAGGEGGDGTKSRKKASSKQGSALGGKPPRKEEEVSTSMLEIIPLEDENSSSNTITSGAFERMRGGSPVGFVVAAAYLLLPALVIF